jgi:predicted metal-dependent phosphoesterase TrpH
MPFLPGNPAGSDDALIRFDMHVHSVYSPDSVNSIRTIVQSWRKNRVLPLVCDHDTIRGSVEVCAGIQETDPDIPVILAEEIMTRDGEIIGAFLTEEVPPGLSAEETLDEIRDQGAVSVVPHPFCTYRKSTIDRQALLRVAGRVDCIEGYNARVIRGEGNRMAIEFADRYRKPVSAGSDAHTPFELSTNYLSVRPFGTPGELLRNLSEARISFPGANPGVHYITKLVKAFRSLERVTSHA